MHYSSDSPTTGSELGRLYDAVGWTAYTADVEALIRAIANSTYVVTARDPNGQLVGLARAISDDVSIAYVQDVLVDPAFQRSGIGYSLVNHCLDRFEHVRQRVLLTDDEPHQHRLYRSLGFRDVAQIEGTPLHAFVNLRIPGSEPVSEKSTK